MRRKVGVQRAPHIGVDAVHGDDEESAVGEGEAVPVLGGVEGARRSGCTAEERGTQNKG